MRWLRNGLGLGVACAALLAGSAGARGSAPARHVVMISIDGLRPQMYTNAGPAKIPTIRRLMKAGMWARVTGVLPTVTYPSHTTLITGVPPSVHGIYDNRLFDPEGRSNMAWYWYARDIRVETLAGAVRTRGGTAAAISWPVTVGMDLDYGVPEIVRSLHLENLELMDALSTPRHLLSAYFEAMNRPFGERWTDAERAGFAAWIERRYHPTLLLLHIYDTDSASHEYGPDSPEALQALERADTLVGDMLAAIKDAGLEEMTDVLVVSDHGFLPLQRILQPNAVLESQGLIDVNDKGVVKRWDAYFHSAGGSGYFYVSRPGDRALATRVDTLVRSLAADPANGIAKVWTRADLDAARSHPDALMAITMRPGFYSGTGTNGVTGTLTGKGGHGFDPALDAMKASLVMAGPDVPASGDLGLVSMTRIAPTVAKWLDVRLSPDADQPLDLNAGAIAH